MKRFAILALLAAFVLGAAGTAAAEVVVKADGQYKVYANYVQNFGLDKNTNTDMDARDDFNVAQRARLLFRFVANENLDAVFYMQYGWANWGQPGVMTAGQGENFTDSIGVKRAYVSFRWPDTDLLFKLGYQNVAQPSAYSGGWVLNEDVAAAVAVAPVTDMVTVIGGYIRGYDQARDKGVLYNDQNGNSVSEEIDLGLIAIPVAPEGFSFTPWFIYGYAGSNSTTSYVYEADDAVPSSFGKGLYSANASNWADEGGFNMYWAGGALSVDMFDPFVFMADFYWGKRTSSYENLQREGWFADFAVQYTGLDFVTPELVFAYGSGENDDIDDGSERMPVLANDDAYSIGSFFMGGAQYADMGGGNDQLGFWALGLQMKDITFIEKFSHDLNVVYFHGTNDADLLKDHGLDINYGDGAAGSRLGGIVYGRTLFDKDHIWEVSMVNNYQIYEELSAIVELGWLYANFDEDSWQNVDASFGGVEQAWKLSFGATYNF
jgi:hypothetical protein